MPSKPVYLENSGVISGGAECYMELLKSWHLIDSNVMTSVLSKEVYNVRDSALSNTPWALANSTAGHGVSGTPATSNNGFCLALELECFQKRSDIISGLNTLASSVYFEYNANSATNNAYVLDFFCNYDYILCLQDGLLSVRF
jgi:hypothetical protein